MFFDCQERVAKTFIDVVRYYSFVGYVDVDFMCFVGIASNDEGSSWWWTSIGGIGEVGERCGLIRFIKADIMEGRGFC